jgi:hypothetical protein
VRARTLTILLLLAAAASWAQSTDAGSTTSSPGVEPGEPEIVMPQVILQIEDLSVEKVEAQLPPEEDLLPPERSIPVMSEGELAIGEPALPSSAAEDETVSGARQSFLSSEVLVGAGFPDMITGSMSLKTLGKDPRFSVQFSHETLDGFSGQEPGSGFSLRDDGLTGSVKLLLGPVDMEVTGAFSEQDNGLQSNPDVPYTSALARSLGVSAGFSSAPLAWLSLNASLAAGYDSLTLVGATPFPLTELAVEPAIGAQARFGAASVGLDARYWFRQDDMAAADSLHRFEADATFAVDLPATFIVQGSVGWFWNSAGASLVPFTLSVTGTPFSFLTLSLEGGYAVVPYDLRDILGAHSLAIPVQTAVIADDHGWYADASTQLSITSDLALTAKLSFMTHAALPSALTVLDAAYGLYDVAQGEALTLASDVGMRWGITQSLSVSLGWTQQYLALPLFTPQYAVTAEIVALEASGRYGGNLSVAVQPTLSGLLQLPVVRLSGFWKISDVVKLRLDCDDLLWPLLDGSRWDVAPDTYVTPGFRVEGSLSMSL